MTSARGERLLLLVVGVAIGAWLGGGVSSQLDAIAMLAVSTLAVFLLVLPRRPRRPMTSAEIVREVARMAEHERRQAGDPHAGE